MPLNAHIAKRIWGPQSLKQVFTWNPAAEMDTWEEVALIPSRVVKNYWQHGATISVDLTVAGYLQPQDPGNPDAGDDCYVVADLVDSSVNAGGLNYDDVTHRGFYTHAVDVQMGFSVDTDGTQAYSVEQDTPLSSPATGSAGSGSNESVGFFGDQLTASAGTSSSQSRTYQDFEVTNNTTHGAGKEWVKHHLQLRVTDGGGGYSTPWTLRKDKTNEAYGIVPRAAANNPLTSAASFLAQTKAKVRPPAARLHVQIGHTVVITVWDSLDSAPARDLGLCNTWVDADGSTTKDDAAFDASGAGGVQCIDGWFGIGWWKAAAVVAEQQWAAMVDWQKGTVYWA